MRLTTSEKIKIELARRNMTQTELAEKLGLNKMTISQRISSNAWKVSELYYIKHELGFDI